MSSRINTLLIIGATSGIGEAFARRFHGLGKKLIITGRNVEKLKTLAQELPGIATRKVRRNGVCSYELGDRHCADRDENMSPIYEMDKPCVSLVY